MIASAPETPSTENRGRHIQVCLYNSDARDQYEIPLKRKYGDATDVAYDGCPGYLRHHGMVYGIQNQHVISAIDATDKRSADYEICTGVFAVGTTQNSCDMPEQSFLSHQVPGDVLEGRRGEFARNISQRMEALMKTSRKDTVDVVLFGGSFKGGDFTVYRDCILQLDALISPILGRSPLVMVGPKYSRHTRTEAYASTQERRLHIVQPDMPVFTPHVFPANRIEEHVEAWKQEREVYRDKVLQTLSWF